MENWTLTIFLPGQEFLVTISESSAANAEEAARATMGLDEIVVRRPEGLTVIYPKMALGWNLAQSAQGTEAH